ncbi:hypothetical protein [Angelakisella massiliensis]|uniref:hypothetical protein n=1 Tax=Angelakisella massiliensis TaxID=1871018 RepID=UPI0024B06123|nr:hypothetical protein [Angelakisella massiliensis]
MKLFLDAKFKKILLFAGIFQKISKCEIQIFSLTLPMEGKHHLLSPFPFSVGKAIIRSSAERGISHLSPIFFML